MPASPFARRALAALLVALLSAASVLAARGARKPFSPEAPDFRRLGPAEAKAVIVEFSDFECPACRHAERPLAALLALHEGRVRLVYKHFPLERIHRRARAAAVAAECAGRQGRFWEMHRRLYEEQQAWASAEDPEPLWSSYARQAGLDAAAWTACRADPSADAAVSRDVRDGDAVWVGSTPTFFINGRRFVGAAQLGELGSLHLERELKK